MAASRVVVPCPAKINLFLAVGPVDERGYHPIRTIFQAIGLFDRLTLEVADGDEFTSDDPDLPEDNTVTKALRLARELLPVPPLRIHLEKRIPKESGLGGGSSDAAGLLRALGHFLATKPESGFLMDVASAVGKDVPFFLVGGRARAEGYGERLTPLEDGETKWVVVVRPEEVGCSTKEAYARLDELAYDFREVPEEDELYNDFERVAPCESLEQHDRLLAFGASGALLTGSGSGVFGLFDEEPDARRAQHRLAEDSRVRVWVAPTLTRPQSLAL